ncbi:hypothetical protein FGKAn22_09840 [Ferrigenium kumadai]|uniref:DUF4845 domain-containing protein n=2 Tax=Ferrigenium kumadai TaxID=1682490 RepID=A0AAN1W060_9PROT|nr:hypothetical protein FGKAn22_09840 [Ferrigenium kumadai]
MNAAMPATQRGLSLFGFLFGAVILVLVSITGLKMIPAYMQYEQIKNLFITIANDPEMQNANVRDIKASFDKRASIDDITAIRADDIEIVKEDGRLVLSASYSVKVPLVANVSLFMDFKPSSAK